VDAVRESLRRPYHVTWPMVAFVSLVPCYIFVAQLARESGAAYRPELALDRAIPLQPIWTLVYSCLYLTLILLPIFLVRQEAHIRRTVYAFLTIWISAYAVFWFYPTIAPRSSDAVPGSGFAAWSLRQLYEMDPPYNCFPSLHVAHSFASAITCLHVHRRVGFAAIAAACFVAVSTLFTKQHYVLDVIGGIALAVIVCRIFLRGPLPVSDVERRAGPFFAAGIFGFTLLIAFGFWIAWRAGA
jgi:membrane-associated phospholipid phosphatase